MRSESEIFHPVGFCFLFVFMFVRIIGSFSGFGLNGFVGVTGYRIAAVKGKYHAHHQTEEEASAQIYFYTF